jgi:SAM-dependent methyltransferase
LIFNQIDDFKGPLDAATFLSTLYPDTRMKDTAISITERLAELSDLVRIRLLRILEHEELSVGEVSSVLQLPQSTISRQLKVLLDGGWVTRRSVGPASLYRLLLDDLTPDRRPLWLLVREQSHASDFEADARRLRDVIAQRRLDSQTFFGRVAGEWDAVRAELFGPHVSMLGLLGLLDASWTVADLGCGTGNAAELLSPHVKRVICVDQSPEMLSAARKRLAGIGNVEFLGGPLLNLPLESESVDAAVLMLVLHHVDDVPGALAEARRVLVPGGRLLIVDMVAHTREEYRRTMGHRQLGFAPKAMEAMLLGAGLIEPRVVVLPGTPEAKGPGLLAASGRTAKA